MRLALTFWYTMVWALEWVRFLFHYMLVWGPPVTKPMMMREEKAEILDRMKTGPMRFEYQRIELLKHRVL